MQRMVQGVTDADASLRKGWMTMKLKLDEQGHVVVVEGKPVYVHDDGKEIPFDAVAAVAKIGSLNGEAKGHRERAEKAEATLKGFEGIEDAAAAKKAIDIVKNLDAKKLVDAGEVEKVRAEAIKAVEEKYAPIVKERDQFQASLVAEKIGGSFARSKMIADKLAIPADMVEARFGKAFKLEGDSVVAYDHSGNKIFSRLKPGEVAGFDEALELLIENYPHKDHILKSTGASGGGAQGGAQGGNGGAKTMKRGAFDALSPADQSAFLKGKGTLTD
jgi:Family of unknown function (DUF6651)